MAKYTENPKTNTDLHQQMPAQNPAPEVDRQGTQHYILENDQAKLNKEEKTEVDRTYIQETARNNHPSSHQMEPPREEEKSQATKLLTEKHRKGNKGYGINQERNGEDDH